MQQREPCGPPMTGENRRKTVLLANIYRSVAGGCWTAAGLIGGRTFPGKIRLTRKPSSEPVRIINGSSPAKQSNDSRFDDEGEEDRELRESSSNSHAFEKVEEVSKASAEQERTDVSSFVGEDVPVEESHKPQGGRATDTARVARFKKELSAPSVDLDALRELAWSGVPEAMRPNVWRLLLGYAPPNTDRRGAVLSRKRQEYRDWVPQYYEITNDDRTDDEVHTLRQISVDVPRTVPEVPFFQQAVIQTSLERILYIWAIRHPASGYVQGINDLVTPFLTVFLSEIFPGELETWPVSHITRDQLLRVEADCFWCLSKLLDGIQDHYTFAQPGIQRLVFRLKEIVRRIDEPMAKHIEEQGLEYLQFSFRWINCLLIREIPFALVTRLWDTYLSEGDGFSDYLVYACASFMLTWTDQLQALDFQEMLLFLQHLPTRRWTVQELEMVLSRAFMWRVMFDRSPSHLIS